MKMEPNPYELMESVTDFKRELMSEQEELQARADRNQMMSQLCDIYQQMLAEQEDLRSQLEEKNRQIATLEEEVSRLTQENETLRMQNNELKKISSCISKKSTEEGLIKALTNYINISKRKTVKKRGYIKMVILELLQTSNATLPNDAATVLESFDDEEMASLTFNNFAPGGCPITADHVVENNGTFIEHVTQR